ncbi:MAG: hypothetical protein LBS91_09425 [Clostridiales Family XIII bacterium]|jgi:hypothetical protein|nr:hypothetical protein [Clostridiales Family XIII bacterium]
MVEAAIFFPIAVFCAMAVLALLLNIYSQTATQAHIHVRLRAEAAAEGDRTQARLDDAYARDRYRSDAEGVSFETSETPGFGLGVKALEASQSKLYFGGKFTNPRGYETEYFARSYIVDEAGFVRLKDGVSGVFK